MTRPPYEVTDVIRQHGTRFIEAHRAWLTAQHLRVLRAIAHCRTAALGGHLDRCAACGYRAISFNSYRNRHCPKCLTHARNQWLDERQRELLPVGYAHVVFTLPHALATLALQNKRVVYDLLFQASAATLLEVARSRSISAPRSACSASSTPGGRLLLHHPHVHCVVPAGGLSPDGTRWVHARASFFLPVKILSRVFRGKFVAGLRAAFRAGGSRCRGTSSACTPSPLLPRGCAPFFGTSGSSTPSPHSAARATCSTIWPGTPIGSRSRTID